MPRKQKFRPEISRVKLTIEQAVLTCSCYDVGEKQDFTQANHAQGSAQFICRMSPKGKGTVMYCGSAIFGSRRYRKGPGPTAS